MGSVIAAYLLGCLTVVVVRAIKQHRADDKAWNERVRSMESHDDGSR